jgi:phosphonate transport system permease protein
MTTPINHPSTVMKKPFATLDLERYRHNGQWRADARARRQSLAIMAAMTALLIFALIFLEFSPIKIWNGLGRLGEFARLMVPPTYGTDAKLLMYLKALAETLGIALLGTLAAALLAFPLAFLAAKNVVANRIVHFFSRRLFDTIRGVDTLIYALIWINVVGLGPFAGVLAIMTADLGAFGKLFSEAIETSDKRPVEGVMASGGGALHAIRFGIIPQVLPVIASQALYYFESNTRSATIIGIVGAGGIGLHLAEQIRTLEWQHVSFLILMILVTVAIIDWVSTRLRFAIIGARPA